MIIGIDPGTTTGLAIYRDGLLDLHGWSFWDVVDELRRSYANWPLDQPVTVIIESTDGKGNFRAATSKAVAFRMGTNVGTPMRDGKLLAELCKRLGFEVIRMAPVARNLSALDPDKKTSDGKMDHADFMILYPDYLGAKTNNHKRDAAGLIAKYLEDF